MTKKHLIFVPVLLVFSACQTVPMLPPAVRVCPQFDPALLKLPEPSALTPEMRAWLMHHPMGSLKLSPTMQPVTAP